MDARLTERLSAPVVERIVDLVPDHWLEPAGPLKQRAAYGRYLMARLQPPRRFFEEALRARAAHL